MPLAQSVSTVPVVVNDDLCIADKGCKVCADVCPLDVLRIVDMADGRKTARMEYDECWYCMPCEADCPTGAVKVNLPYLLK